MDEMETFRQRSMETPSFTGENGYGSYNRSRWESSPIFNPWEVFSENPCTGQCKFPNCNLHLQFCDPPQAFPSGLRPPQVSQFRYGYEPGFTSYVSGVSSVVRTRQLTKKPRSRDTNNSNDKKLMCQFCKRMFLRPSTLKVHMRIHSGEKPFKCTYCPRAFSQSGNLTVHLRMHTGERPFMCTICTRGFSQSNSLQAHVRTHTGERPFQCKECYKRFADRSTLAKHHRVHTDLNTGITREIDDQ